MSPLTLIHTNGSTSHTMSQPWLQSSVQQFFSAINWEDNPPEVQELKLTKTQTDDELLSMTLSVSQFFGAIAWDGRSIAAPPTHTESSQPSKDVNFTLDDFSELF